MALVPVVWIGQRRSNAPAESRLKYILIYYHSTNPTITYNMNDITAQGTR